MLSPSTGTGTASTEPPLSFRAFVQRVKPSYVWYRHCEALAAVLQRVADDDLRRVMVFLPPRHSKSESVSRLFTAYYLYRHPERWVGVTSYAADLAYTLSRASRDHYRSAGGSLRGDAGAVKHWESPQGGGLWAAGVGGPITGKGFHLGVIDDPLKNAEEAASETIRAKQKEWYQSTFYTREEPGGSIVVIQTRWNEDDLAGWLLSEETGEDGSPEGWHVVRQAALAEEGPDLPPSCTREPEWRQDGEALCPERYPVAKLKKIESRIGSYHFGALYQQRPTARQGDFFQRAWFPIVGALPAGGTLVRYWDKAGAAPGKGDYTVGLLMARTPDGRFWVVDVQRFQKRASERNALIVQTAELDRQRYGRVKTYVEQPPGLAKESTDEVIRLLAGFPAYPDKVSKDKIERAEPFQAQAMAGNVSLLRGEWNEPYLRELAAFPTGAHDDQVDGSSGAFMQLAGPTGEVKFWTL